METLLQVLIGLLELQVACKYGVSLGELGVVDSPWGQGLSHLLPCPSESQIHAEKIDNILCCCDSVAAPEELKGGWGGQRKPIPSMSMKI